MFFDSWSSLLRIPLVGVPAYIALLVILRISGNRTLSKFSAFDLVITVAFGSALATAFLQSQIPLVNVVATFAALVLLQFCLTWSSVRSERFEALIKHTPKIVFRDGVFLDDSMRAARVTREDIIASMRSQGIRSEEGVEGVVLEGDGAISVIPSGSTPAATLDETVNAASGHNGHDRG